MQFRTILGPHHADHHDSTRWGKEREKGTKTVMVMCSSNMNKDMNL
jgi:hypothetical protein